MYESFFHLTRRPFAAAPLVAGYIPTTALEQARTTLVRCVERAEGIAVVVGPPGTGKSLLCQLLAEHFRGRFQVAALASARLCTRRALLQNILFELKLPYRGLDEGELRLSLVDRLEPRPGGPEALLLLVDEAHTLPLRLLEEIRLITNLVRDGQPRIRLVLAGSMALEERLASPKLAALTQRIAARCYLQPMNRDETIYFVEEQLRRSGGSPENIFTADALRGIHTATDGIPRLVNQLCDHALILAALGEHQQLDLDGIEEAWADLQQLPAAWNEPTTTASPVAGESGIIEFGQLSDDSSATKSQLNVASRAESRLATIESGLSSLGNPASGDAEKIAAAQNDEEFSPVAASGTEIELVFQQHDPFGSGWQEEEVVIDRYASLEEARLRKVSSEVGREIGAAIAAALTPVRPKIAEDTLPSDADEAGGDFEPDEHQAEQFNPASDPLLPDESAPKTRKRRTISLREMTHDDRDLIVIDEQPRTRPTTPADTKPKRREYRQLFSTLRNR